MSFEDKKVIGWRAYYSGQRVFVSTTTAWADLPSTGVLFIVLYEAGEWDESKHKHYRRLIVGGDWYYYDADLDEYGYVLTHKDWGQWADAPVDLKRAYKQGEAVSDEEMAQIEASAMGASIL